MNPLNTVRGTIAAGVVLAVLIALVPIIGDATWTWSVAKEVSLIVWIHVLAGITWIGLLYYFNFVQVPALAEAASDEGGPGGAGITKYVAPRALWWFRWGALVTWLSGALALATAWALRRCTPVRHGGPRGQGSNHRRRRMARHDHAVQRVGPDLAESEENPRHGESIRRRDRQGAPGGLCRLAHQHPAVHPHADEHGRLRTRWILHLIG